MFPRESTATIYIIYISWQTIVKGNPKASYSIAIMPRSRGGHHSFPRVAPLTLNPYVIRLSVK